MKKLVQASLDTLVKVESFQGCVSVSTVYSNSEAWRQVLVLTPEECAELEAALKDARESVKK